MDRWAWWATVHVVAKSWTCLSDQHTAFFTVQPSHGFSSSHVWMWELDYKESWAPKNWCFWTVVLCIYTVSAHYLGIPCLWIHLLTKLFVTPKSILCAFLVSYSQICAKLPHRAHSQLRCNRRQFRLGLDHEEMTPGWRQWSSTLQCRSSGSESVGLGLNLTSSTCR